MPCVKNNIADQTAHMRSLVGDFVIRCLERTLDFLLKWKFLKIALEGLSSSYLVSNAECIFLGDWLVLQTGSCNRICHLKHIHARILIIKLYEAYESANVLFAVFLKCDLPVDSKGQPIIVINEFFADESIRVVTDE